MQPCFINQYEADKNNIMMYAIVNIAGQQIRVSENQQVIVNRLKANEGDVVSFNEVLITDDGTTVTTEKSSLSGVSISAKVISHIKGDKVIIFKKKRRKGYQKQTGHRQQYTKISIEKITV